MEAEHGEAVAVMRALKAALDPTDLMNPGKIVDALPMDQGLRYGENYHSPDFVTNFEFEEGSFAAAVEMCTGVGAWRKVRSSKC